jgi:hypothetical protein
MKPHHLAPQQGSHLMRIAGGWITMGFGCDRLSYAMAGIRHEFVNAVRPNELQGKAV